MSRQSAHESGKVVSPTHRPSLPPGNDEGKNVKVPVYAIDVCWESRFMEPLILNVATRWRPVMNFTSLPLYPRKKAVAPNGEGARTGVVVLEKSKISYLYRNSNLYFSSRRDYTVVTGYSNSVSEGNLQQPHSEKSPYRGGKKFI